MDAWLRPLLVIYCSRRSSFPCSRALFAIERADLDFALNFAAIFIMLTLGLWLVKIHGPFGAALGLIIAGGVTSILRVGAFLKLTSGAGTVG